MKEMYFNDNIVNNFDFVETYSSFRGEIIPCVEISINLTEEFFLKDYFLSMHEAVKLSNETMYFTVLVNDISYTKLRLLTISVNDDQTRIDMMFKNAGDIYRRGL